MGTGLSPSFLAPLDPGAGGREDPGRAFLATLLSTDGMSFFQLEEMCWSGRGGLTGFDFDGMLC